ncbi:FAD-dependent oxidoreductase (plasmid) [Arthrobacter sp. D3-18]
MKQVVVVGGSIAAMTAAGSLRSEGFDGDVTVLSDETHRPYSRVPLSKGILAGTEAPSSAFLPDSNGSFEIRTDCNALALDTQRRRITLADGEEVHYDGLVISTGARARRLPGPETGLTVRTIGDAVALRDRLSSAQKVIVLGGGFLGMEVASTCRTLGRHVTVVHVSRPLSGLLGGWLAEYVLTEARRQGVEFIHAPQGAHIIDTYTVDCGDRWIEADLVVSAVGDDPNIEWLLGSGVPLENGVLADQRCRVAADIVAAGDVVARRGRRMPHWTNAVQQGKTAAAALLRGEQAVPYVQDHYFWTHQFGLDIKISGRLPLSGSPAVIDGAIEARAVLLRWEHDKGATAVSINHRLPIVKLKRLGGGAPALC